MSVLVFRSRYKSGLKHEVRYLLVESHAASPFPLVITDQVFHFATIELLKRVFDISCLNSFRSKLSDLIFVELYSNMMYACIHR